MISKRILFFNFMVLSGLLLLSSGCQKVELKSKEDDVLSPLRLVLSRADRIYMTHVDHNKNYKLQKSEAVKLMENVKLRGNRSNFQCICYSDLVFYLYKGEALLDVFAYYEEGSFAWQNAGWSGDGILTERSYEALSEFFHVSLPKMQTVPLSEFVPPPLD